MKQILAIDYGTKKSGIAKSDELGIIATPITTIPSLPQDKFIKQIEQLISEYNIGAILIGVPYGLKNKNSKQTEIVREFIETVLKKRFSLPIFEIDESFSSKIALDKLHTVGKKYKKVKNNFDAYAAAVFLQEFLDNITLEQKEILKD